MSRQGPLDIEEFLTAIRNLPDLTECLLVARNLGYILQFSATDVEALKDFVLTKLKTIPCASETTMLILETVKSTGKTKRVVKGCATNVSFSSDVSVGKDYSGLIKTWT
ncbi:Lrp/AsnC family transcriptional regulator [Phaeobacter sp. NW0010-22]|uniref:Lrp/AsnC family transcriptional regulator n=1 Tax=Phaeobacter sp. NW0010-22 TaxID=3135907 RepID=UPI00333FFEFC